MMKIAQVFDQMRVAWWTLEDCGAVMRRMIDPNRVGPAEPLPVQVVHWAREEWRWRGELMRAHRRSVEAFRSSMQADRDWALTRHRNRTL